MANPTTALTAFAFNCNSFEELPKRLEEEVGYKVTPTDVWSINIVPYGKELRVVLTIIYWKANKYES